MKKIVIYSAIFGLTAFAVKAANDRRELQKTVDKFRSENPLIF